MTLFARLFDALGGSVSHTERLVSALGGGVSILAILLVSAQHLDPRTAVLIVPSMGASAVLLFAVPHGALSQPWNVFGGHLVSALIGVTCYQLVPHTIAAASLAVGLAIGAMHYLRCIHPPGGATALAAVIGGETTHALGYRFALTPVLENVLVILAVAVLFNYLFKWRRYPAWLIPEEAPVAVAERTPIEHSDLVAALAQIDSFIDVSEHDLLRIYELATGQADRRRLHADQIGLGHYYSNGAFGADWSVRQIVDESHHVDPDKDMVVFKVVAGKGLRSSGVVTRTDFARWASYELEREETSWKRVP
ncbi:MAG: HPP family protein [Pseudomonadota bacterium]